MGDKQIQYVDMYICVCVCVCVCHSLYIFQLCPLRAEMPHQQSAHLMLRCWFLHTTKRNQVETYLHRKMYVNAHSSIILNAPNSKRTLKMNELFKCNISIQQNTIQQYKGTNYYTFCNMDESHKHYAKLGTKACALYDSIHMNSPEKTNLKRQKKSGYLGQEEGVAVVQMLKREIFEKRKCSKSELW